LLHMSRRSPSVVYNNTPHSVPNNSTKHGFIAVQN
jgi:hypothetical protein